MRKIAGRREGQKSIEEQIYDIYNFTCEYNHKVSREEIYSIINKLLLLRHCDLNIALTPLNIEIAMNNKERVINLLDKGANVNEVNDDKLTPLAEAIYLNNYELAEFFIKNGASVHGNELYNPLFVATLKNNYKIMELLLKNNVDANQLDSNGFNALHHLFNNGATGCLRTQRPGYYLTFAASYHKSANTELSVTEQKLRCLNLLYEYGIDVNYSNEIEKFFSLDKATTIKVNPLSLALESSSSKVLKRLMELGVERTAIELSAHNIYAYQDSFDFINDIRDGDISCWIDAPSEYIHYLKYMHKVRKYDIEVFTATPDDGYRRSKLIKKLEK